MPLPITVLRCAKCRRTALRGRPPMRAQSACPVCTKGASGIRQAPQAVPGSAERLLCAVRRRSKVHSASTVSLYLATPRCGWREPIPDNELGPVFVARRLKILYGYIRLFVTTTSQENSSDVMIAGVAKETMLANRRDYRQSPSSSCFPSSRGRFHRCLSPPQDSCRSSAHPGIA